MLNMEKSENCNEFDQLYSDLCNKLREMGKAASFCQLIKNSTSDLHRIAILNKDCSVVPSLIKTVKKCRNTNSKDPQKARELFESYCSTKHECDDCISASDNLILIRLLSSALSHLQIDGRLDFLQVEHFESNGIATLENLLTDDAETAGSDEHLLLSDIYRERANCFYEMSEHKMTILESLRAIRYGRFKQNNPHQHLFLLLFRISTSLRHLNQWQAATNVLQFSIKWLRLSKLDNATKSVETMRLVKLLKDIQTKTSKEGEENVKNPLDLKSILEPINESFPKVFHSVSDALVNTSSSLQLKWHEDRGRHLIATKTIPIGKITNHSFS